MIESILWPVICLGGLGLIFGSGLAFASKKFAVEVDPRVEAVKEILPGANCGGCGYPGCDGFANAVVNGEAPINGCLPGGPSVAAKIAEILGKSEEPVKYSERMVAKVMCQGSRDNATEKYRYIGIEDCVAASMLADGPKGCKYGCLGLGTCVKACPFGGIHINEKGIAQVDPDVCTGCGKCVVACPRNVIQLVQASSKVQVVCVSKEKGKKVKDSCKVGCIGCGICARSCKFDAIKLVDNLPRIDYDRCVGCMVCAEKCPTGAIWADFAQRKVAFIDKDKCVGCGLCKKTCQFEAIEGERKETHRILQDRCTGCGECVSKCPVNAIVLK